MRVGGALLLVLMAIAIWAWLARERSAPVDNGIGHSVNSRAVVVSRPSPSSRDALAIPSGLPAIPSAESTRRSSTPSAECIAAQARDARENAALAAMSAAQREAHIEASAREAVQEEQSAMRAADACEGTPESSALQCLLSTGFSRAADVLRLYRDHKAIEEAYIRHAERVAARGDARSLLAAAHILPFAEISAWSRDETVQRRPAAIEWVVRAQRIGVDDAAVQWGVATFREYGEDPTEALERARIAASRRLLALEPDNAAAHLLAHSLSPASREGFTPDGLRRLAELPTYRSYTHGVAGLILDAFRDMPYQAAFRSATALEDSAHATASLCASEADAMLPSQLAIAFTAVVHGAAGLPYAACDKQAMRKNERLRRDCLNFFARVHASSRLSSERGIAAAIARRAARSDADLSRWRSEYRRHRWQMTQSARTWERVDRYVHARVMHAAVRGGDEATGIQVLLREAGISLDPPVEWQIPGEADQ